MCFLALFPNPVCVMQVYASYLEVYNEVGYDLLDDSFASSSSPSPSAAEDKGNGKRALTQDRTRSSHTDRPIPTHIRHQQARRCPA